MASPSKPRVERPSAATLNERLVDATLQLLRDEIPGDLTVRRIAAAAGTTTMALYTGFGSRDGLLDVVYARGFEQLRERSQLIVITHQKPTMEVADALYGVTMRDDGITAVISPRLRGQELVTAPA